MKTGQKGFTLVEVIIAITLLAIIGAILGNLIFLSLNIRNTNRERQEALNISTSVIDEIKSYQGSWKDSDGLGSWLVNHGFVQAGTDGFKTSKSDSYGIRYDTTVQITEAIGIEGLFKISIKTKSPRINELTVVTYFRG